MTFPRIRAPGLWVLGSVLSPAEVEEIDQNLTEAIDGTAGGTYSPTAPVVLGASGGNTVGLHVTAHAILDDFEGHVKSGFDITVENLGGVFAMNGSTLTFLGLTIIADGGGGGLNGTLEIGNGFAGNGHVVVRAGSDIALNGTMAVNQDATVTFLGAAGHQARLTVADDAVAIFNGTSGHVATVVLGQHSTTTLDGGFNVSSLGALTVLSGGQIDVNSGGSLTVLPGGLLALEGVTSLGAAQPAPTADPGANNLLFSTNTCKAWGHITTDGLGGFTIDDGYNVASAVLGLGILINFVRPMANTSYAVAGMSIGSKTYVVGNDGAGTTGVTLLIAKALDSNAGTDYINLATTAISFTFVVFARQS